MTLSGRYYINLDGKTVHSKNIITNVGREAIKRYLAGDTKSWAAAIGLGVGASTASVIQTKLDFEVDREPISLMTLVKPRHFISSITISGTNTAVFTVTDVPKIDVGDAVIVYSSTVSALNSSHTVTAVNYTNKTFTVVKTGLTNGTYAQTSSYVEAEDIIIVKAVFSDELSLTIREVGVLSSYETRYDSGYNVGIISDFSEDGWGTFSTLSASSIGDSNVSAGTSVKTLTDMSFSMDSYSVGDTLQLAVINPTSTIKTITVTLYTSATEFKAFTFTTSASTGFQIVSTTIDALPISTVRYMTIQSNTTIDLDALSVVNYDEFGNPDKMISRSVVSPAIVKTAGQQLEIEYALRIG